MASTVISYFGFDDCTGGEPSLDDLFAEPIVKLVMERDQVNIHDMRRQMDRLMVRETTA